MSQSPTKTIEWPVLGTWFDTASPVDQVPWGRWRYLLNMRYDTFNGWGLRCGFERYGKNARRPDGADLAGTTLPITRLYSHQSPKGYHRLYAGAGTVLASQGFDGHWRTAGVFESGSRFRLASVNNVVLATNGEVKYQVEGREDFASIPDLGAVGLSRAGGVASWKGVAFLFDVTMDGVRAGHRLVWSDLNDPLSWSPATDSIAGFQDLAPGEVILSAIPLADALFLFTTNGIWRVVSTGDENVFGFQQVYYHKDGEACLKAADAIAAGKDTVVFLSHDSLYEFNAFQTAPTKPDWLEKIGKRLLATVGDCNLISAEYHPLLEEFWFSYAEAGSTIPSRTLCLNRNQQSGDEQDHGFWSLLSTTVDEPESLYEWMVRVAGCSSASLAALWPTHSFPFAAGSPTDDFCDLFPECTSCRGGPAFLMVSATDNCVKALNMEVYSRELRSAGQYVPTGYGFRFLTGNQGFSTSDWKRVTRMDLSVTANSTRSIKLTVGISSVPSDKLTPGCRMQNIPLSAKSLACPAGVGLPNESKWWNFMAEGRFLTFDFTGDPSIGEGFWLSRLAMTVERSANSTP